MQEVAPIRRKDENVQVGTSRYEFRTVKTHAEIEVEDGHRHLATQPLVMIRAVTTTREGTALSAFVETFHHFGDQESKLPRAHIVVCDDDDVHVAASSVARDTAEQLNAVDTIGQAKLVRHGLSHVPIDKNARVARP